MYALRQRSPCGPTLPSSFHRTLDQLRSIAENEREKGALFERLMRKYFTEDPLYRDRFANVWLWAEWPAHYPGFDRADTGIDLVAQERDGSGYCAIQCKCYAPGTTVGKPQLDSFVSASARDPFTSRIVVDTGDEWGPNALKTLNGLKPACNVVRFGDLAEQPFDWPDLTRDAPEDLALRPTPFSLRPHQQAAFDDVIAGLERGDSGKLVMACGTGKTFTALRIAEKVAGAGGRVLYLVPSISLFAQSMREWANQRELPHRYIGVCSDTRAGRQDEDASLQELEIPVTTAPDKVAAALRQRRKSAMTVVFSTYHSLPVIEQAQGNRAPGFDLILCDEAHRTTGVERPGDDTSPFVLVHDRQRIRARKRLYMTATPRLYTEGAKSKAADHGVDVFSMDDESTYGPELHRLPFSKAVEQGLLSDYKVVVLALSEQSVDAALQAHLASGDSELNITDAAKIVGCWQALQNPENSRTAIRRKPLKRAIAFTNTILSSKRLVQHWNDVVDRAIEQLPKAQQRRALRTETQHVDGQHHALDRKARIEWLKSEDAGACRILSNARCLSEGIDVPALDAVLFMSPRSSHVDIVQAVGRAMRKAEGKENGYIVLPVAIPQGVDPAEALNDNKRFAVVWSVLRALRSHDDRLDAEINKIDLNSKPTDRIIFSGGGFGNGESSQSEAAGATTATLPFAPLDLPPGAIYAKVVEKCGDRKYWESWAKDVADIFARLVGRIEKLLAARGNQDLREWFDDFLSELKASINDSLERADAVAMMAQHILTRPVFSALFEHYDFAASNPVAKALDALREDFGEFGLENEVRDLEPFYESIRLRARGLDNPEARQRVLMELYEKFFATALKKDAERLGIVYTPVEVVDFILHSADHVLRQEFGKGLTGKDVRILDPFTGTGIFLVRLLQSESLIKKQAIKGKFGSELFANELVLLAYYIAAIHIEEAYHGRLGPNAGYAPFEGIVLTDTFNLRTDRTAFPKEWMPANSKRAERQQKHGIQVIVGNPPWSVGQRSAADDNANVAYPDLERRISETYASRSSAQLRNSLYDTYKMAIRWASDRIGDHGVVAFVTNGSWIDSNVDSGLRACLAEEFSSIYVLNLRGNQRTQGERSRQEGGKVFGQGSRAPVAISLFVRNPKAEHDGCEIHYRDIGDYLSRQEKLDFLRETVSVAGIADWQQVSPNAQHDWIDQRSEEYQRLHPLGTKGVKAGRGDHAAFQLFSNGWKTGKDAYFYNYSPALLGENSRQAVNAYARALRQVRDSAAERDVAVLDAAVRDNSAHIRWDRELKRKLEQRRRTRFSSDRIRPVLYRPFVKQHCYVDPHFAQAPALMGEVFPPSRENRAICVTGVGSTKHFSVMIVDVMPDLELISKGQCFPRYRYRANSKAQEDLLGAANALDRVDNITDATLKTFRVHYRDPKITKTAIFDYIYGVLHAPDFRQRFANDLAKELPRIPFADDFHAFRDAGKALARLHLGYETSRKHPLEVTSQAQDNASRYRLGTRKMRYKDDAKSILAINDVTELRAIPPEAHRYEVNGRTPLDWLIDRYHIVQDRQSGIVNDPNAWFDKPEDLLAAIQRVVHVSVETVRIVEGLPEVG